MFAGKLPRFVSPTSGSAAGVRLLACQEAWSIQVKTNSRPSIFWLLGGHAKRLKTTKAYVCFCEQCARDPAGILVAQSDYAAKKVDHTVRPAGSDWYEFNNADRRTEGERWENFGHPNPEQPVAAGLEAEAQIDASLQ
jgi:hypothetical protein